MKRSKLLILAAASLMLAACQNGQTDTETKEEIKPVIAEEEKTPPVETLKPSDKDAYDITGREVSPGDYKMQDFSEPIRITKGGTYTITGEGDQMIAVDAPEQEVTIVLNDARIDCTNSPAIYAKDASKVEIKVQGTNVAMSSNNVDLADLNGVIYSRAPLVFSGNGYLKVYTELNHAIRGRQDITFESGSFKIDGQDDAIHASGNVTIEYGTFDIYANGEGIEAKGSVYINEGHVLIDSAHDAVHVNNDIKIAGGQLYINSREKDALDAPYDLTAAGEASLVADGGESPFDCQSGFTLNGGNILGIGVEKATEPKESDYPYILVHYAGYFADVEIKDGSESIAKWKINQPYELNGYLTISSSKFKAGQNIEILINGQSIGTVTLTEKGTTLGI